jgi:hypothetical protein
MTLAELGDYLDVSLSDLSQFIEGRGKESFPAILIGDEWFVSLSDVQDWLLQLLDNQKG